MTETSIRILFFGPLKEIMGATQQHIDATQIAQTRKALIAQLSNGNSTRAQALSDPSVRLVIDNQFTDSETDIHATQEIAFLPPLSGG